MQYLCSLFPVVGHTFSPVHRGQQMKMTKSKVSRFLEIEHAYENFSKQKWHGAKKQL